MRGNFICIGILFGVILFTGCFNYVSIPMLNINYPNAYKLSIESDKKQASIKLNEFPNIKVKFYNYTQDSILFVYPGDGSRSGYRTPVISWSVEKVNRGIKCQNLKYCEVNNNGFRFCGNINSLKNYEIVTLNPFNSTTLNWVGLPHIPKVVGKYRIKFEYLNNPDLVWKNESQMSSNEIEILNEIKSKSKFIDLISNELIIEIVE